MTEPDRSSTGVTRWDVEYSIESWCTAEEVDFATMTVEASTAEAAGDQVRREDDDLNIVTVHRVRPHRELNLSEAPEDR